MNARLSSPNALLALALNMAGQRLEDDCIERETEALIAEAEQYWRDRHIDGAGIPDDVMECVREVAAEAVRGTSRWQAWMLIKQETTPEGKAQRHLETLGDDLGLGLEGLTEGYAAIPGYKLELGLRPDA